MNIVDIINTQDSWGRNQVLELPGYGDKIYSVLARLVAQPFYQPFQRFKLAYGVLVGKYDALQWVDQ